MGITTSSVVLPTVLCAIIVACLGQHDTVQRMSIPNEKKLVLSDSGHAVNCGKAPFNLTWTPKDLAPTGQVTVYVDFTLPFALDGGFVNVSLYFHGESDPFLGFADTFTCEDLKKYVSFLPCPLSKGFSLRSHRTITNLHALTSYPGTYDAVVDVKNSQNQPLLCLNVTVHINEV